TSPGGSTTSFDPIGCPKMGQDSSKYPKPRVLSPFRTASKFTGGGIMKLSRNVLLLTALMLAGLGALARSDDAGEVKEKAFDAPNKVRIKVRVEGPYAADGALQDVCG